MKKGIIMEIDESFLTLMTPEGEFLHAKRQNQTYSIGEEIHFFPIEMVKTSNSLNPLKTIFRFKPVMGLMSALVIFLGVLIPMYQNNRAYAYMSIDVNPSIELGVNKKMQVVEMTGFNQEGKKIISRIDNWEKKDVSDLAKTIIAEIKKDGFLQTKENVIISTVRTKEPEVRVEKKLQENIEEIKTIATSQQLEVTVLKATEKERKKAHELGITIGKLHEKEIKESKELIIKEKAQEEQTDKKAVPVSPKNQLSTSQKQIQIKKALSQKNKDVEPKKKTVSNHVDRKIMPPGQLKKIEVNQQKQTHEQQKKQNEQQGKKSENKKTKSNENQKSKVIKKQTGKSNEGKKGKNNRNSSQSKKAYGKNDNKHRNK